MTMHTVIKGETPTLLTYPPVYGQATSAKYRVASPAVGLPSEDDWTDVDAGDLPTKTHSLLGDVARGTNIITFDENSTFSKGERSYVGSLVSVQGYAWTILWAAEPNGPSQVALSNTPIDMVAGTPLYNYAIPVTLTAAQTAVAGMRGLVKMSAVIDAVTYEWDEAFQVVDEAMAEILTVDELQNLWPSARRFVSSDDYALTKVINSAWVLVVEPELQARGVRGDLINNVAPLKPVMVKAVQYITYAERKPDDLLGIQAKHDAVIHAISLATASPDWWAARNETEDVSADVGTVEPFARIRRVY